MELPIDLWLLEGLVCGGFAALAALAALGGRGVPGGWTWRAERMRLQLLVYSSSEMSPDASKAFNSDRGPISEDIATRRVR